MVCLVLVFKDNLFFDHVPFVCHRELYEEYEVNLKQMRSIHESLKKQ